MKPYLYIIMRNDLASMNPGKAMAHAAHAANAFVHKMERTRDTSLVKKLYNKWAKETPQGFGTTIVLAGTLEEFDTAVELVENDGGIGFGHDPVAFAHVHDPSYPVRDGAVTHLIPLDTCAYFFCDSEGEARILLNTFGLHP